jgi:ribosome-associated heat shock protein Hsp15
VSDDRQRIDKWLWHARAAKTRTAAQRLVESGYVRLNGKRIDAASQTVKINEVVTIVFDDRVRVLKVRGFAPRRGGPAQAQALYDDESPPPVPKPERPPSGLMRDKGAGRPTKRDRRRIDELKTRD